ncbi:MAG TPA: DUF362 domain-containing protein [Bacteroidales bacterium]|nr:DUF362 domain-containing protein [Bacteroidales bacterium]
MNRRHVLKSLAIGAIGVGFAGCSGSMGKGTDPNAPNLIGHGKKATFEKVLKPSNVSLVKGNDARDNTYKSLMAIEDEIMTSLQGKKRILIKPNFVVVTNPLCATNVEAVRGILDFIKPRFKGPIEIGEATVSGARNSGVALLDASEGTFKGFKDYGYLPLEKEYDVKLTDLNLEPHITHYIFNPAGNRPQPIRIISKYLDADQYLISASKLKTHNCVLVTMSLKNILMGAPKNDYKTQNDKFLMHAWNPKSVVLEAMTKDQVLHYNLFQISQLTYPDLGVIDAWQAMEGDGPVDGAPVDTRMALASVDPLALDTIGTKIMGFDPTQVLYLSSMNEAGMGQGDSDKINVLGANLNDNLYKFKPHSMLIEPYGLG